MWSPGNSHISWKQQQLPQQWKGVTKDIFFSKATIPGLALGSGRHVCLEGAEEGEGVIIWKYGIIRQETWKCNLGFEVVPSTRGYFGSKGLVYARQAARSNFTPSSSLALLLKPRSLTNSPSPLPFNYSETCFKLNTVLSWRCPLHVPLFLCTIVCMLMSLVVLIITSTLDSFVGCFFFILQEFTVGRL